MGEIVMGLRFSITRAHRITSYRVLFGRDPMLPSTILKREFDLDSALQTQDVGIGEAYVDVAHMSDIRKDVVQCLALYNSRAKKYAD